MEPKCPYRGLQPFDKEDEPFFAGREKETQIVISNLHGVGLTILYGESGVGKTSLIRAGVLPELEKDSGVAAILFRDWQSPQFERQLRDRVLQAVLESINHARGTAAAETHLSIQDLQEAFCTGLKLNSVEQLYELPFHQFVQESSAAFYGKLFFIFDQFEEYIYYHPLKSDGDRFDAALASAVNDRTIRANFLLSLREDGLGKLDRLRGRIPDLLGNVIRLEHLDRDGAVEAIDKPLQKFSELTGIKVVAESALKLTLLEQVDVDELEMDEADDTPLVGPRQGDSGSRYKALALQAVLTQLWSADVTPLLQPPQAHPEPIQLQYATLTALARDKKERETEVRFLVRTYFDNRLEQLAGREREIAAEVLRGLVRAGGHKRARTVDALANETMMSKDEVESLLNKLTREPFKILRNPDTISATYYELNHDVMAFAIMDWSNRERQTIREHRQLEEFSERQKMRQKIWLWTTAASVAITAAVLISGGLIWWHTYQTHDLERKHAVMTRAEVLGANANQYLLTNPQTEDFNPALLAAIDGVALCLKEGIYAPPDTVAAMRLAAQKVESYLNPDNQRPQERPASPRNENRTAAVENFKFIPAFASPSGKFMVTVEHGRVAVLWDTWTFRGRRMDAVADDIAGIGFSQDTTKFAVVSTNGSVWTWDLTENNRQPHTTNNKIDKELDIPLDEQTYYKGNQSGAWKDYEQMAVQSLIEAIALITRQYTDHERVSFRSLKTRDGSKPFTDEIYRAYEQAKKDPESAKKLLGETLREFGVKEADPGSILAHMYVSSARLEFRRPAFLEAAKDYDRAQALDPRSNVADKAAALKKLQEGNDFAKTDIAKAQQSYAAAVKLDNSLTSLAPNVVNTSPELQQESKAIPQIEQMIKDANDLAIKGNTKGAMDLYNKAKAKAPNALEKLNPAAEIEKFAPKGPRENPPAAEAAPTSSDGG